MKNCFLRNHHRALPIILILLFSGCGGGGGGNSNKSITAISSTTASSSQSIGPVATKAPQTQITPIGGTFVAEGVATLLLNTAGSLTTTQRSKASMSLYVLDNDNLGQSTCITTECITTWPPLLADTDAVAEAPLSIIQRTDGHKQWALRNRPLYFYSGDTKVGDLIGEGVGGVWHVAVFEPLAPNKPTLNALDGDYFTAAGKVMQGTQRLDRTGFSLYTFDDDTLGISNCTGGCLTNWPALEADANDKAEPPYSIITRPAVGANTSVKQWAYQDKPLYFFSGDTLAGQTNGNAIAKWHLARQQPLQIKSNNLVGSLLAGAGLVKTAITLNSLEKTNNQPKHGFTLYTSDNDTPGVSLCTGTCLSSWPALLATAGAVAPAPYSLIARASGEMQWALHGMPLYFSASDSSPGNINGEDVNGVWHVARIPPVATDGNGNNGLIFTAHGNIVNASGVSDKSRDGFTLYAVTTDPVGQSSCNGSCLVTWPALYAPTDAISFSDFSVIVRTEGAKQWAYKGKPLYFYTGDTKAGDITGVYGTWFLAKP